MDIECDFDLLSVVQFAEPTDSAIESAPNPALDQSDLLPILKKMVITLLAEGLT